jgi:hypothetical protein
MIGKLSILLLVVAVSAIHISDDTDEIDDVQFTQPGAKFPNGGDKRSQDINQSWKSKGDWNSKGGDKNAWASEDNAQWWGGQADSNDWKDQDNSWDNDDKKDNKGGWNNQDDDCEGDKKVGYVAVTNYQTVPGVDVTIVAGLWAVYNDLFAQCSSIVLVYAATLKNANGSVTWRAIIKLTNRANMVTYIAVQLVNKAGKWNNDHQFITRTLTDIFFLWNLNAKVKLANFNLQASLSACQNPFSQLGQDAVKKAVAAAAAAAQASIRKIQADNAALHKQIAALQARLKNCVPAKPSKPSKPSWFSKPEKDDDCDDDKKGGKGKDKPNKNGSFVGSTASSSFGSVVSVGNKNFDDTA